MDPKPKEHKQAFNLYFQTDMSQQQIADLLSINRKTLYTWMKEGDWKRIRYTARHAPSLLVDQYYEQLANLNRRIASRTDDPVPTKEEADTIRKISMTIKQVRTHVTPSEVMDVFMDFSMLMSRGDNQDRVRRIMPLMNQYVQQISKHGKGYSAARQYYDHLREDEEYEAWLAQQQQEAGAEKQEPGPEEAGENGVTIGSPQGDAPTTEPAPVKDSTENQPPETPIKNNENRVTPQPSAVIISLPQHHPPPPDKDV